MQLGFVQLKRPLYDPATSSMAGARDSFSVDAGYTLEIAGAVLRVSHSGVTAVCPLADMAHGLELLEVEETIPATPAAKARRK